MTPEQGRVLNYLASSPFGHATVTREDAHVILLETGGNVLACGCLYDIVAKPLGAGVYKLSLTRTH
jgi:hypothetical protein